MRRLRHPVKILGSGELTKKLTVHAHAFSKRAVELIEAAGGAVVVIGGEAEPEPPARKRAAKPAPAAEPAAEAEVDAAEPETAEEPEAGAERPRSPARSRTNPRRADDEE